MDKTPHAGVKGDFVGKQVPPDGKRTSRVRLVLRRKPDGKITSRIDHMLSHIWIRCQDAKIPKEVWENLKKTFAANTTARKIQL